VYSHGDRYGYVRFFKQLFPDLIELPVTQMNHTLINRYDIVIKLSSNDSVISHPKIISLLHLESLKDTSKRYISLTNFIQGTDIINMFPAYTIHSNSFYNNVITFVGFYIDKWCDEDFDFFIKNTKYRFNFIVWAEHTYPKLSSYSNIQVLQYIETNRLSNILLESKFILARKPGYINYDRFCGCFTLAASFKKPLIVDKKTQETYGFPGLVFDSNYSEILPKLNSMTDSEYDTLVNDMTNFRDTSIKENKSKMDRLLKENF